MLARFRARLTYANVMASVAVFVSLGGSSYAAITISGKNVKDGSLTGKDVHNNSLTGSDVKDASLLSKDFKSGQLPQGAKGDKGDKGDRGAPGTAATNPGGGVLTANIGGVFPHLEYYGAVDGVSTANSDETVNQSLSPNRTIVLSNLRVLLTTAPSAGATRFIYLRMNGSQTALSCTISDLATSCSSDVGVTVPGGSRLSISVGNNGGFPALTQALVGMTVTPQ